LGHRRPVVHFFGVIGLALVHQTTGSSGVPPTTVSSGVPKIRFSRDPLVRTWFQTTSSREGNHA
jgi:hypothetical protein